jgi:hypothetical protein
MKNFIVKTCMVVFLPAAYWWLYFLHALLFLRNEEQMWGMAAGMMQGIWYTGFGIVALLVLVGIRSIVKEAWDRVVERIKEDHDK